jgi:NAD(P)-dependent dehydrogenase (short-subunit alcohol dehydrogenase family)
MGATVRRAADGTHGKIPPMARTALVTGAGGGLGPAVVGTFLADGWRVVAPYFPAASRDRVPDGAEPIEADLTDTAALVRVVALAREDASAPLGAVVNIVGGFAAGQPVIDTPLEAFEAQFALNLRPTYLVTQAALPALVATGGGAIVCFGSSAALQPWAGGSGYAASKAAVIAFARAVAKEHAADGVRCNVIAPSLIDTPANRAASPDMVDKMVPPERIAAVVRFLCSDESASLNGVVLPV